MYPQKQLSYLGNVANASAESFYRQHGVEDIKPAYELSHVEDVPLMFAKHCLRYSIGHCLKHHRTATKSTYKEPFFLIHKDLRLRLKFDCRNCQMLIYKT